MNTRPQAPTAPTAPAAPAASAAPQPSARPEAEVPARIDVPARVDAPARADAPARIVDEPAASTAGLAFETESLSEVYKQANVRAPGHGFSILKVAEMLGSGHIRDFSSEMKGASILLALEASNVPLNDVMDDAVRRERALNEYEARQQRKWQDYKAAKQQQNKEIQADVDRLLETCRSRIQANEKEVLSEKTRLDAWRTKKREEERLIRAATSYFPGSAIPEPPPANGEADASLLQHEVVAQPEVAQVAVAAPTAKKVVDPRAHNGAVSATAAAATAAPAGEATSRFGISPSLWKR